MGNDRSAEIENCGGDRVANNEDRYITDDLSDIETKELMDSLPNYFDFSGDIQASAYLNWRFDFTR